MPNQISQIQVGGTTYDICDATVRQYIPQMTIYTSNMGLAHNLQYSSDVSLPLVYFVRWNCFVNADCSGFINVSSTYVDSAGSIPMGFRPDKTVRHCGVCYHNDGTFNGYYGWEFTSGGIINFSSSIGGKMIVPINFTYYCTNELPSS